MSVIPVNFDIKFTLQKIKSGDQTKTLVRKKKPKDEQKK